MYSSQWREIEEVMMFVDNESHSEANFFKENFKMLSAILNLSM